MQAANASIRSECFSLPDPKSDTGIKAPCRILLRQPLTLSISRVRQDIPIFEKPNNFTDNENYDEAEDSVKSHRDRDHFVRTPNNVENVKMISGHPRNYAQRRASKHE